MKKTITLLCALTLITACSSGDKKPMETPKDQLVAKLFSHVEKGEILYGHQDDLSYGHAWKVEDWEADSLTRSDVKAVTGMYPAIVGFDLGGIEMGDKANLDSVDFGLIRKAAMLHAQRGGIVTFSWHPRNPLTGGDAWDISSDQVVKSLLQGGELNDLFKNVWLKRLGDFMESLEGTPVIFRPWHENVGSWFWWGGKLCTEQQYKDLYRTTWIYLTEVRKLDNILWCYSPNSNISVDDYMSRYPGDEFVDMFGIDHYGHIGADGPEESGVRFANEIKRSLTYMNQLAKDHHKLMCLSETGLESLGDPTWWTRVLYPAIADFPVAYVLTWRNAHDKPGHFYAPWDGFENVSDFKAFCGLDDIVFLKP